MAIKMKMERAGLKSNLLDKPDVPSPIASSLSLLESVSVGPSLPPGGLVVKDDPLYASFFKMLKNGVPSMAIKMKMEQAGLKSNLLDTPDAPSPQMEGQITPPPPPPPPFMSGPTPPPMPGLLGAPPSGNGIYFFCVL